jgi:hypothetical protein
MTKTVEKIAAEVSALPEAELDELLAWLADFESKRMDTWDEAIAADSKHGGRLQWLIDRARDDIQRAGPNRWMKSSTTSDFRALYGALPADVQARARRAFVLWRANPRHPSLCFTAC